MTCLDKIVQHAQKIEDAPLWQICGVEAFVQAVDALAIISATNIKGTIIYANDRFSQISGYSRAELVGQNHRILNSGHHPPAFFKEMWETLVRGEIWRGQIKNRAKDRSFYWVDTAITPFKDDRGKIQGYTSTRIDISKEKAQNFQLDLALNNMARGLSMFDAQARLIVNNNPYRDIYQLPKELTQPGTPFAEIIRWYEKTEGGRDSKKDIAQQRTWTKNYIAKLSRGETSSHIQHLKSGRTILITNQPLPNGGWVDLAEDVTEKELFEAKIAHMAHHDALTDLPNRLMFDERLELELRRVRRGETFALHLLDLDQFKAVNDTLGHQTGDQLLKAVAERSRRILRETDMIARLGGDEFAILQTAITMEEEAAAFAERLIDVIKQPYDIGSHQVLVGASIGVALAPADGDTADQLIKNADMALYQAKAQGGRVFCFFEKELNDRLQARSALVTDLREALAAGEIELHYQPIVQIKQGQMTGVEALMRWHHPERGPIPPSEFIPLAEEVGLIVPLGDWAIRQACAQVAAWGGPINVAINVSPLQFKQSGLVATIASALAASGLQPNQLEIEITESVLLKDSEENITTLCQLHQLGVRIALDDFGTGYSSLSYLHRFPLDKIKIDRSFIKNMTTKDDTLKIVRAIVTLARSLGIMTTAEGVETKEQLDAVRFEGCDEVQGYLIGRPIPADDFERLYLPRARVRTHSKSEGDVRGADDDGHEVDHAGRVPSVASTGSVRQRRLAS
jgi:diguanylate cyclase (GGDEF)-like protein/PAS domain S-box-containing protein